MPSLVVIGAQWGDEGKGKLVDYLSSAADYAVRFQGGDNAGHTLVVEGKKTALRLIPSGILQPDVTCCIGAGVVANPETLIKEIAQLRAAGVSISPDRLIIDRFTQVVAPYHGLIDRAREEARGENKIGTTGKGIGPAYEDRARRTGIRFADFFSEATLRAKVRENVKEKQLYLTAVLGTTIQLNEDEIFEGLRTAASALCPFVGNVSVVIDGALKRNKRVVFEGAQGTLLDQSFGTIPFVTSSHTLAGGVATGVGIGPKHIHHVLGVAKAYATRVGTGPFPTELFDATGNGMRERGGEFGTVTGRPRRCGWFDAVLMREAVRLNGIDSLAITKLDVLAGLPTVRMCVKYLLDGKEIAEMPSTLEEFERLTPHYVDFEGWDDSVAKASKWHHLPASAKLYLDAIEEVLGCPISITSVGADREATIFSRGADFVKGFLEV